MSIGLKVVERINWHSKRFELSQDFEFARVRNNAYND